MFTDRRGAGAPWPLPLALALALLLAACGGSGERVRTCSSDAECGPGALCLQSACVTNRRPAVTLQLPAAPTTHRALVVEATAADSDPGDSITRFAWTVTPVGAACDAEPEPSSGPALELVFWCAGTYQVTVVAEDARGASSLAATQTVEVAPATGAPVVTTPPALEVEHACGGAPFACRPAAAGRPIALPLSATVDDPAGGALISRWRLIPPPGAGTDCTVSFAQGEASLTNQAWMESRGVIAGTWRFRLRVAGATGLLGQADQVVVIGNRPPELAGQAVTLAHRHEGGRYLASGQVALPATDPDGDPLTLVASLDEAGTDGCTSRVGAVTSGSVEVETSCAEPARLLGAATRILRVVARDAGGGATEALFPIEIGNRPPVVRLASNPAGASVAVDHTVGACPGGAGDCYLASGTAAFEAVDPDGDPLPSLTVEGLVGAWHSHSSARVTTAAGVAWFGFATAVGWPTEFRTASGATGFTLQASSVDPFGAATTLPVAVVVGNRPPLVRATVARIVVPHRYDAGRGAWVAAASPASFEDPDGDPLLPGPGGDDPACRTVAVTGGAGQVECTLAYAPASGLPPLASFVGDHRVPVGVTDGWAAVAAPSTVSIQNGSPALRPFAGTVESCACRCAKWNADGNACLGQPTEVVNTAVVPLPVLVDEADGDPLQVTFTGVIPAGGDQKTVLPGSCAAILYNPTLPVTVQVTVDDGVVQSQTASTVIGVTCPSLGRPCEL